MEDIINQVVEASPIKSSTEANLFKEAVLSNSKQLNKTINKEQIAAAWERWKRERGYENSEAINDKNPYVEMKFRK
jgi:post-segregation antitoxin (ccd killing protein)